MGEEPEEVYDSFADRHAIPVVLIPVGVVLAILLLGWLLAFLSGFPDFQVD